MMRRICICGGGALGHVIAGYLSAHGQAEVVVLTSRPSDWQDEMIIYTPGESSRRLLGKIHCVTSEPQIALSGADIVLLCLPGFLIRKELLRIREYLEVGAYIGSVFSSTGFFFESLELLDDRYPLWGFQRVPFISRIKEYGHSANLLGYKNSYHIAVERASDHDKEKFRLWIENAFGFFVTLGADCLLVFFYSSAFQDIFCVEYNACHLKS